MSKVQESPELKQVELDECVFVGTDSVLYLERRDIAAHGSIATVSLGELAAVESKRKMSPKQRQRQERMDGRHPRDAGCAVAGVSSCLECPLEHCVYDDLDKGHVRFVTSLSDRVGKQVIKLWNEGWDRRKIAIELRVSYRTVCRIVKDEQDRALRLVEDKLKDTTYSSGVAR